jgi:hypothetical protein
MRVVIRSSVVAAVLLSGLAHAQEWIEYEDRAWGFSINFPHEPKMEQIDHTTFFGQTVPARVYSAERGTGRYSLIDAQIGVRVTRSAFRERMPTRKNRVPEAGRNGSLKADPCRPTM